MTDPIVTRSDVGVDAERGVLLVVPSADEGVSPSATVAGLPLVRRVALAAERAGWRALVVDPAHAAASLVTGTRARVLGPDDAAPEVSGDRLLVLSTIVLPQTEWLQRLIEMPLEPDRLYLDDPSTATGSAAHCAMIAVADARASFVVGDSRGLLAGGDSRGLLAGGDSRGLLAGGDSRGLLAGAPRWKDMGDAVAAMRAASSGARSLDASGRFVLASPRDVAEAETALLRSLIKPNEGFMSRHFERRISLALTRRLCTTRLTPNVMTLVSLAIGFAGAPFFLSAASSWQLVGALLFLTHSILDGCDGELARLKFMESRWGAALDAVGDNLVHAAVFVCMALGWSLHARSVWPLVLGGVAVASTLCIAGIVHARGMRASTDRGPTSALSRAADVFVYRDFIYLIVALAALGLAQWFVALTAVGAPIFLILLAWLGRARPPDGVRL